MHDDIQVDGVIIQGADGDEVAGIIVDDADGGDELADTALD